MHFFFFFLACLDPFASPYVSGDLSIFWCITEVHSFSPMYLAILWKDKSPHNLNIVSRINKCIEIDSISVTFFQNVIIHSFI